MAPSTTTRKRRAARVPDPTRVEVVAATPAGISREDIARRAYEIYEARGKAGGSPLGDWVLAEQELAASIARTDSPEPA